MSPAPGLATIRANDINAASFDAHAAPAGHAGHDEGPGTVWRNRCRLTSPSCGRGTDIAVVLRSAYRCAARGPAGPRCEAPGGEPRGPGGPPRGLKLHMHAHTPGLRPTTATATPAATPSGTPSRPVLAPGACLLPAGCLPGVTCGHMAWRATQGRRPCPRPCRRQPSRGAHVTRR